jgi:monoamine oxidase
MMNSSFLELLREDGGNYCTNMVQISDEQTTCRTHSCPRLHPIRYGARMAADHTPTGYSSLCHHADATRSQVILPSRRAVPRWHIEILSRHAQTARHPATHYDASAKIFFKPAVAFGN